VSSAGLIAANAAVRLAYGVAAFVSPSKPLLGRVTLAPDTEEFPEARLFIRGFAAHQIAVAAVGFASLSRPGLRRPAMLLAATTDAADIAAAVMDAGARGRVDQDLAGGIVFSSAGLASALVALET
jgi:hypothetical protein